VKPEARPSDRINPGKGIFAGSLSELAPGIIVLMSIANIFSKKQVLIIDDLPDMRSSLRMQISALGVAKVHIAGSVRDALELITQNRYDLILCDYYLGAATNGQQFLEFLRTRKLISRATVFIMVTAEKGYESVMTVAEMLPDDYLLKPFTGATLETRLEQIMEKKTRLEKIDKLQDTLRWCDVVEACNQIMAAKDRYFIDAMRIKGNALLMQTKYDEARTFYQDALKMRSTPWAKLGLAKAIKGMGDTDTAVDTLRELNVEHPRFMVGYDLLSKTLIEQGQHDQALEVLSNAAELSPNSLARQRSIAAIAETLHDYDRVERAMSTVLDQTKYSPLRESSDVTRLGTALVEKGDPAKALNVLKEARQSFKGKQDQALLAATECLAHSKAGDPVAAKRALDEAMTADFTNATEGLTLTVARACLASGDAEAGERLLKNVVQNNPDSAFVKTQVSAMMGRHGLSDRVTDLLEKSEREIIELNNEAVRCAQAGDLSQAAAMLCDAAQRLPSNVQIVSNAAYAFLLDIIHTGYDEAKFEQARKFTQQVASRNMQHPKLAAIAEAMKQIREKYRIT
jgi:tetratricopeptide (TPR) repeat protein